MSNQPNKSNSTQQPKPLLPGNPLPMTDEDWDEAAQITEVDIERALGRARRLPLLQPMMDAKKTTKGRE